MSSYKRKTRPAKNRQPLRVVIIGANFAGLTTAINLPRNFNVNVIDCRPQFEFLPNIHELLSGIKKTGSLRMDLKRLIERAGHRFIKRTVTTIDPVKKIVYTSGRKRMPYDICVVAVGGINNTSGIAGAVKFGLPFKSVEQCQTIALRLKMVARRQQRAKVVIVGGGLEGVEALGEILRQYRRHPTLEIHLIENRARLLADRPQALDRDIRKICKPYKVHFHTGTRVTKIAGDKVWLSPRATLDSDATILTGGVVPPPLLRKSGLTEHPGDWAPVNNYLQSKYDDSVFVAGDAAGWPELRGKQAYDAIDMGECVAKNINLMYAGKDLNKFRPAGKPNVISFGDLQTYVVMGNIVVGGPLFAGAKEGIFQATMAKLDPPSGLTSAINFCHRTSEGIFNLAIPALTSFSSLRRLSQLRFIS